MTDGRMHIINIICVKLTICSDVFFIHIFLKIKVTRKHHNKMKCIGYMDINKQINKIYKLIRPQRARDMGLLKQKREDKIKYSKETKFTKG